MENNLNKQQGENFMTGLPEPDILAAKHPEERYGVMDTGTNEFVFHGTFEQCERYLKEHPNNLNLGILP